MATAGRVLDVTGAEALVTVAGRARRVSLAPLLLTGTPVIPGMRVLLHAGFAVALLDEAEGAALDAAWEEIR